MYDQKTPNLQLPLPAQGNMLQDDVGRLRASLTLLDADSAAQNLAITLAKQQAMDTAAQAQETATDAMEKADKAVADVQDVVETIKAPFEQHVAAGNAHGATSQAAAGTIVLRDAYGRAQVADPSEDADIVTMGWVEKAMVARDKIPAQLVTLPAPYVIAGMAMSEGHVIITFVNNASVYISSDGGATFTPATTPVAVTGARVAMSGSNVILCSINVILISNDYGATWSQVDHGYTESIGFVAMDGSHAVILFTNTNSAIISSDFGATWTSSVLPYSRVWSMLAMEGSFVVAASDNDTALSVSIDYGRTWSTIPCPALSGITYSYPRKVACSDGRLIVSTSLVSNCIFMSTDYGATWDVITLPFLFTPTGVAADGRHLLVTCRTEILLSSDYGETWVRVFFNATSNYIAV
ncbi:hypothetical protein LJC47_05350, partial [Desulfosarcina sp. OttesenSCG-928-B08]|nr:hypothetical protein [Desulfosarcina sp. OttesenSCG-928-B08]